MVEIMNTTQGLNTWGSSIVGGWILTLLVGVAILLLLFALWKGFRQFIYGAFTLGIFLGVYKLSRYIGKSADSGNFIPIKWFGYVAGFIVVSIAVGYLISRFDWFKKLEADLACKSCNDGDEVSQEDKEV